MNIAVIDAGFQNVNRIPVFDSLRLLGTEILFSPVRVYMKVMTTEQNCFSCMAANSRV
jgi:hypothetical protein